MPPEPPTAGTNILRPDAPPHTASGVKTAASANLHPATDCALAGCVFTRTVAPRGNHETYRVTAAKAARRKRPGTIWHRRAASGTKAARTTAPKTPPPTACP